MLAYLGLKTQSLVPEDKSFPGDPREPSLPSTIASNFTFKGIVGFPKVLRNAVSYMGKRGVSGNPSSAALGEISDKMR